jgi:hypothetical protein
MLRLRRLPFPFQRGNEFLRLSTEDQVALLKSSDLDREMFIMFKPIFDKLSSFQRALVAAHQSCDPALLAFMDSDEFEVRLSVAQNPMTPKLSLLKLASDDRPEIREAIRMNASSDAEVLSLVIPPIGYLECAQDIERIGGLTLDEAKQKCATEFERGRIKFIADYRRPTTGIVVYRVESNGRLRHISTKVDSSD